MDFIKKLKDDGLSEDQQKDLEGEVQTITDAAIKKIDDLIVIKEADILKV